MGKGIDWNAALCIISIDLTKAFDKVKYATIFSVLSEQGIETKYIELLKHLYADHQSVVEGHSFPIRRGVRQGNILNPLLFSAALENVMRRWADRLFGHGLILDDQFERLRNLCYADDLLLFGKSLSEMIEMKELWTIELDAAGLSINPSKTKILTADTSVTNVDAPLMVEISGSMTEGVNCISTHEYLGKLFGNNLIERGPCNLAHWLRCGWMNYH